METMESRCQGLKNFPPLNNSKQARHSSVSWALHDSGEELSEEAWALLRHFQVARRKESPFEPQAR